MKLSASISHFKLLVVFPTGKHQLWQRLSNHQGGAFPQDAFPSGWTRRCGGTLSGAGVRVAMKIWGGAYIRCGSIALPTRSLCARAAFHGTAPGSRRHDLALVRHGVPSPRAGARPPGPSRSGIAPRLNYPLARPRRARRINSDPPPRSYAARSLVGTIVSGTRSPGHKATKGAPALEAGVESRRPTSRRPPHPNRLN
jgi:hypothetical protein